MSPDEVKAIRHRAGLSARGLAQVLGLQSSDGRHIRMLEAGDRQVTGPVQRILEMLDRGELPARYMPPPVVRGRPKKGSGE